MKKKTGLMLLLSLLVCQAALASDAAKSTLPSGMNNPMTSELSGTCQCSSTSID